ncbi:hypothetical protein [Aurantiacibacter sediminis]|uniref:Uncharacterized protein n=1 Tax=Aurantiacibacter sediminis TaxID=2793064 RepID=A0ABS0N6D6_9SPHN|nr:hypothetical protein [Aurantiacibacter sediminis]MBH5323322.1 hypothetical protein [Aurantiacibacter sediminis]
MKLVLAAVSALALAATPALAQGQGNGNGNGNRGGGGPPGQVERGNPGNGGGNAQRGNRGGGNDRVVQRGNPGNGNANRGGGNGRSNGAGNANRGGPPVMDGGNGRGNGQSAFRGNGNGNGNGNGRGNRNDGLDIRLDTRGGGGLIDRVLYRESGIVNGCPPGLARKRNGCLPPGQARQLNNRFDRYSRYSPNWWGLPYGGSNYFYDDGFLLRYDGNRVSGFIPLLGGALTVGNVWPSDYGYREVPRYTSRYYGLGDSYRFADNVAYRLDPETAAITSVAALLTGDEFTVGSPMPRGYDVYNVPYGYRDRYRDGPDRWYRYNDGYVYQVDPETRLVAAAIELLI